MADRDATSEARPVVHVVDPDPDARASAVAVLQHHAWFARGWADPAAFLSQAPRPHAGGCILLDMGGSASDALAAQRAIGGAPVPLPVIMTAARPDLRHVIAAMKNGAVDFLIKPIGASALVAAVADALRRRAPAPPAASPAGPPCAMVDEQLRRLSARERQVLDHLTDGLSNKEIALALNISPRTVEIHRANLMAKLGAEPVGRFEDSLRSAGRTRSAELNARPPSAAGGSAKPNPFDVAAPATAGAPSFPLDPRSRRSERRRPHGAAPPRRLVHPTMYRVRLTHSPIIRNRPAMPAPAGPCRSTISFGAEIREANRYRSLHAQARFTFPSLIWPLFRRTGSGVG
jgi:two-component system response regulator FixJ